MSVPARGPIGGDLCVPCILGEHERCEGFLVADDHVRVPCTCRAPHSASAGRASDGVGPFRPVDNAGDARPGEAEVCCALRDHVELVDVVAAELLRLKGLRLPARVKARHIVLAVERHQAVA